MDDTDEKVVLFHRFMINKHDIHLKFTIGASPTMNYRLPKNKVNKGKSRIRDGQESWEVRCFNDI
jgi:hypothetical protein